MSAVTHNRHLSRSIWQPRPGGFQKSVAVRPTATKQQAAVPFAPRELLLAERSHGIWHQGVHFAASEVRDYELDQFQVVNNAVYASYVQHGRHKAFSSLGLSVSSFQEAGTLMALSELTLQYKAPLRAGDLFYTTTAVAQLTAARLVIDHTVQQVTELAEPGYIPQIVCQGQATVVFLDASYKPVRVPANVKEALIQLQQEYKDGLTQQ